MVFTCIISDWITDNNVNNSDNIQIAPIVCCHPFSVFFLFLVVYANTNKKIQSILISCFHRNVNHRVIKYRSIIIFSVWIVLPFFIAFLSRSRFSKKLKKNTLVVWLKNMFIWMIMVMTPIKCICGLDFFVNTFYEKKKKTMNRYCREKWNQ